MPEISSSTEQKGKVSPEGQAYSKDGLRALAKKYEENGGTVPERTRAFLEEKTLESERPPLPSQLTLVTDALQGIRETLDNPEIRNNPELFDTFTLAEQTLAERVTALSPQSKESPAPDSAAAPEVQSAPPASPAPESTTAEPLPQPAEAEGVTPESASPEEKKEKGWFRNLPWRKENKQPISTEPEESKQSKPSPPLSAEAIAHLTSPYLNPPKPESSPVEPAPQAGEQAPQASEPVQSPKTGEQPFLEVGRSLLGPDKKKYEIKSIEGYKVTLIGPDGKEELSSIDVLNNGHWSKSPDNNEATSAQPASEAVSPPPAEPTPPQEASAPEPSAAPVRESEPSEPREGTQAKVSEPEQSPGDEQVRIRLKEAEKNALDFNAARSLIQSLRVRRDTMPEQAQEWLKSYVGGLVRFSTENEFREALGIIGEKDIDEMVRRIRANKNVMKDDTPDFFLYATKVNNTIQWDSAVALRRLMQESPIIKSKIKEYMDEKAKQAGLPLSPHP